MGREAARTHPASDRAGRPCAKSGLVELTNDDRAVLYGAFLEIANTLGGENRDQITVLWRRRGSRAFKSPSDG